MAYYARRNALSLPSAMALLAMAPILAAQPVLPVADEDGIVPKAYRAVSISFESSLSPDEAVVRYSIDGKGREEHGLRTEFPFLHPLGDAKRDVIVGFGLIENSPTGPGRFHPGIDLAAEAGTEVRSSGAGRVSRTGFSQGYGYFIAIDHLSFTSVYGHLAKRTFVRKGEVVRAGQVIGKVGDSGRCSRPLLHYGIEITKAPFRKLYAVDPGVFLSLSKRAGAKGKAATLCYGFIGLKPRFKRDGGDGILRFDLNGKNVEIKAARNCLPLAHPLGKPKALVTTGFGIRKNPFSGGEEFHAGIDIVTPYGSPVRSPADGTVAKTGTEPGYGSYIILRHGDLVTLFSHLDGKPLVKEGASVKAGDVIGKTGKTGRSTGPHLHYEIRYVPDAASDFKEEVRFLFDPEEIFSAGA